MTDSIPSDVELRDNLDQSRFELWISDSTATPTMVGITDYVSHDGTVAIPHTEIDPSRGGRGYGSTMVRSTLDILRERGLQVIPQCPFVADFIDRNPEYLDLVANGRP